MLIISPTIRIPLSEITISQIRAQGAGGQNVNKVSTAVQLRFDVVNSSLSENLKQRLLDIRDTRLTKAGIIVLKSQNHRTFERNKEEALQRLSAIIRSAAKVAKKRTPTKPSRKKQQKRLDQKVQHGRKKELRKKIT